MNASARALKVRWAAGMVAGAVFTVSLWPMRYLASPRWEVWVVADNGQPISGINARLVYQNYSAEGQSHEITMTTDENGHALFPSQYGRASLLQRVFYTLSLARAGVFHASFGRHAFVFVFGGGYEGEAINGKYGADWRGSPESMESRIVANRMSY